MKVYVVVGHNRLLENISARAVYSSREGAETYDEWFDDRTEIVELELDGEIAKAEEFSIPTFEVPHTAAAQTTLPVEKLK